MGMGGPPDDQRGNWGWGSDFQALHLSVGNRPTVLQPPQSGPPSTPQASRSHEQMPFPSGPVVKPMSWWIFRSPRDSGQMVPVSISCHSATTGLSLTHVHVRHKWAPSICPHPAIPSALWAPHLTPMPSAQHPPVSPDFPQREALLRSC